MSERKKCAPSSGRSPISSACCLLTAYYVLRPLRDEMSIIGGTRNLHWPLTGNFALKLLAVPLFGWVVAKFSRRTFIPSFICSSFSIF